MLPLAIIPSLVLLLFIYKKDKREKEPLGLLIKCFLWGIIIIIPILIMENILDFFVEILTTPGSIFYAILDGFLVAGLSEELFKYLVLKWKTWKSPEYNCSFDGIVYSVFVSLGFATFENIMYITEGGLSVAFARMFTSIPGHTCDAVFMGYYYSKAKQACLSGDKAAEKKYKKLALLVPVILHGLYDSLIFLEEDVVGEGLVILSIFIWLIFIITLFISTFRLVIKTSKTDMYFDSSKEFTSSNPNFILKNPNWICVCKQINYGNFCTNCGQKRID